MGKEKDWQTWALLHFDPEGVEENTAAFSHVSEGKAGGSADVAINCLANRHNTRIVDSMPSPTMTARRRGLILEPAFRAQTGLAKGEAQQLGFTFCLGVSRPFSGHQTRAGKTPGVLCLYLKKTTIYLNLSSNVHSHEYPYYAWCASVCQPKSTSANRCSYVQLTTLLIKTCKQTPPVSSQHMAQIGRLLCVRFCDAQHNEIGLSGA
jgi:hypothetical protein